ncbi:Detected protein of unknown function [Hibiscus syriacus]|uniref:Uncharacterized protein n=1 Tax=Hibiscus syriacus TaxID=106335 RepID=A0A6A3CSE7_HIBSY|nr:uncharacterized protein LOC120170329 [Hibiscus syriacus]KAE8730119.1 Detected protein of unknown function [Hibiscus syriacus]
MKLKNKGKVYPTPSPSSSSGQDHLSILNLLPPASLLLISVLSLDDREVLAYMITRSLKTTTNNNNHSFISRDSSSKKGSSKKHPTPPPAAATKSAHKPPVFDCDCFDCYTSYWFRWDSSPNRELIHQAIESFEEHLTNGESPKPSKKSARLKRRYTNSETVTRIPDSPVVALPGRSEQEVPDSKGSVEGAPIITDDVISTEKNVGEESAEVVEMTEDFPVPEEADVEVRTPPTISNHNGLVRKVLPDILGLFNSRLWGLLNPNV